MRLVIADTGPVNYLIMIGHIDLLPALFEKVILPSAVQAERKARNTPSSVRAWVANPPAWLEVRVAPGGFGTDSSRKGIHEGEQAAIALASALRADLADFAQAVGLLRKTSLRSPAKNRQYLRELDQSVAKFQLFLSGSAGRSQTIFSFPLNDMQPKTNGTRLTPCYILTVGNHNVT